MPARFEPANHRVIICVGAGGVGKTTLSAALAIKCATSGRAVDVMTVDPAPRLLDALGLDADTSEPKEVGTAALGHKCGRLRAMKLDPKRMFDALVARHASSPAARDMILSNRIYRNLSGALAGVADYMAMEQLLDIYKEDSGALIVVDTPPAREAIEFLDAPRRMIELLGSRAITLLGASREMARGPFGMFDFAARAVLTAFDRLTGLHLLADVQGFVQSFDGMYTGFASRAAEVQKLIHDGEETFFVLVTSAEGDRVPQVREFVKAIEDLGLSVGAIAINRLVAPLPDPAEIDRADIPAALKRKLKRNLKDFGAIRQRQSACLEEIRACAPAQAIIMTAPDLSYEPQSVKDLAEIARSMRIE